MVEQVRITCTVFVMSLVQAFREVTEILRLPSDFGPEAKVVGVIDGDVYPEDFNYFSHCFGTSVPLHLTNPGLCPTLVNS